MSFCCFRVTFSLLILLFVESTPLFAQTRLEVVHWWTSKGEAKSIDVIRKAFYKTGDIWQDAQVRGGAGRNLIKILRGRISSGNLPAVVQVYMGPSVWMWAAEAPMEDLTHIASRGDWKNVLPGIIHQMIQADGKVVAVPVNAHRVNWMWINPEVFQKAKAPVPQNWEQFWGAAEKIKQAGYLPIALGGESWQESVLFENILLGVGGADLHNKVFRELDLKAIKSVKMKRVFDIMRRIQLYADAEASGRSWDRTTEMVMQGQAAVQFMGDWAKGEFLAAGKQPGRDFLCRPPFGTESLFLIDTDTFLFFKSGDQSVRHAQHNIARIVMDPEIQEQFSLFKGSIPARLDIAADRFDQCGKDAIAAYRRSARADTIIPSFTFSQATTLDVQESLMELISTHFNSDMTGKMAVRKFAAIVRLAM